MTEKRLYLKSLVTGFEAFLKKFYFIINDNEVTDKNGDKEHAALSNAIYCMRLNKLKYSQKAADLKFAQYVDILVNLRNDENHQAKSLDAKEVQLGIHVVSTMLLFVAFKNITELEMVESKFYGLEYVATNMQVVGFLNQQVEVQNNISILGLAKEAINEYGEQYPAMSIGDWNKLARQYAEERIKKYDIKDDEPINWMAAEEDPE